MRDVHSGLEALPATDLPKLKSGVMRALASISVNKGGSFGGSISGILLNTPGSPEAAATAIDAHPLAKAGYPMKAMKTALGASVVGGA